MVLAGPTDWSSFSMAFIWLELHLLAFDVSSYSNRLWHLPSDISWRLKTRYVRPYWNRHRPYILQQLAQIIGIEEDKLSKPYRPFPSGRISLQHGQLLYLCVMASCIVISICNRLTAVSFIYMLSMWLYNEVGLSMHPISKNLLCAIGYMCYSWGTTYIIGKFFVSLFSAAFTFAPLLLLGRHQPMSSTSTTAIFLSGLIFFTTVRAVDHARTRHLAIYLLALPLGTCLGF